MSGGEFNNGTISRITPDGTVSVLHAFNKLDTNANNEDGAEPSAALVQGADGNFYGMATYGGHNGVGTIFKITPAGDFTTLFSFDPVVYDAANNYSGGNSTGAYPLHALIQGPDGNFYGTVAYGGDAGNGVIFEVTPTGVLTVLHAFSATDNGNSNADGRDPEASLVLGADGSFYGTAAHGGQGTGGTVFKITAGGVFTTLHNFYGGNASDDAEGTEPHAALIQGRDGNFYGSTEFGGASGGFGFGTLFKISPQGDLTTLHSFQETDYDGGFPESPLIQAADGNIYGTTERGGPVRDGGTIFKLTLKGVFTTLHSFDVRDGAAPTTLIQNDDGVLYGLTVRGGLYGGGAFFKITIGGAFAKVASLGLVSNDDGAFTFAPVVQGTDGSLYGVTVNGGLNGNGTIFKLTIAGVYTVLHTFSPLNDFGTNSDGANSNAGLIQGADGSFYGTATGGGLNGEGTIFKITPDGAFTTLVNFDPVTATSTNNSGALPNSSLIQATDGNFYGMANSGGVYANGSIYRITPGGTLTTLHSFSTATFSHMNSDGANPNAGLVQGTDGNLYGLTTVGGANGEGVIFKMTLSGAFTSLYNFEAQDGNTGANVGGASPYGGLIQGGDGAFYGTASLGGENSQGTIFKVTAEGVFTVLHAFDALDSGVNYDGIQPQAALVQASDGSFYGTAVAGGANSSGTIFNITSNGTFTLAYTFSLKGGENGQSNAEGANSYTSLIQGSFGRFYGSSEVGGLGNGAIFQYVPAQRSSALKGKQVKVDAVPASSFSSRKQ